MSTVERPKEITFNELPTAIAYLIQCVEHLETMLETLQPATETKREFIDIDQASKLIKKAKTTIYRLVGNRLIPNYKIGQKLYFYEDELLDWIEKGRRSDSIKSIYDIEQEMKASVRRKPKPLKI